jgi:hypothetical protein
MQDAITFAAPAASLIDDQASITPDTFISTYKNVREDILWLPHRPLQSNSAGSISGQFALNPDGSSI